MMRGSAGFSLVRGLSWLGASYSLCAALLVFLFFMTSDVSFTAELTATLRYVTIVVMVTGGTLIGCGGVLYYFIAFWTWDGIAGEHKVFERAPRVVWTLTIALVSLGVISAISRDESALGAFESRIIVACILLTQAIWVGGYSLWGAQAVLGRPPRWMELSIRIQELEMQGKLPRQVDD